MKTAHYSYRLFRILSRKGLPPFSLVGQKRAQSKHQFRWHARPKRVLFRGLRVCERKQKTKKKHFCSKTRFYSCIAICWDTRFYLFYIGLFSWQCEKFSYFFFFYFSIFHFQRNKLCTILNISFYCPVGNMSGLSVFQAGDNCGHSNKKKKKD